MTPHRITEAKAAVERLIEEGIHCDWAENMKTLKYFFEDMTAGTKEAAHE